MTFTAVVSYESPSVFGPALVYTTRSDVTLQRPDKLRVITPADGPATEFYYDGKTMTAFAPAENLIATAVAPATIDATLAAAFDSAAIYFPFTDLVVADPYKDLAEGLEVAFYIGQSKEVGGTTTDMVAFANSRCVRADLDRRGRQAAAQTARGLSERSGAAAPRHGSDELDARCEGRGGRVRRAEGGSRDAHRVCAAGRQAAQWADTTAARRRRPHRNPRR